jgi:S1-C subfamily serine protease
MRWFSALFLLLWATAAVAAPDGLESALVEVSVAVQEFDPFLPWQHKEPVVRRGYGILVGNSQVLTTENLVRNATLIELRRPRTGEKIAASIELSDCQVDLALLKTIDTNNNMAESAALMAEHVDRTNAVEILQFDETSNIQRGKAQIVNISVSELPTAPYPSLIFSLLTDLNVNGEGAMVTVDGKVAGLIISYDPGTRVGRMLPYPMIKRFLDDALKPQYAGFATAGVIWTPLVDPVKRSYLGVTQTGKGILVLSCLPGTGAAAALKPNDVVLAWDSKGVDNLGYYDDAEFGRLGFAHLIKGRREPGEVAPVTIIRDRAEQTIDVKFDRWVDSSALIPEDVTGEQAEYLVEGGFIFRELTARYLRAHGGDWQQSVDARIVHLYMTQRYSPSQPGEHVVILAGVLPDTINIGYQHMQNQIVTGINGKPVLNMADVFRIMDADGDIKRVTLKSIGVDLVLDDKQLPIANQRIADLYRVPNLRYQRSASAAPAE